jgi:hypothetical protein
MAWTKVLAETEVDSQRGLVDRVDAKTNYQYI